MSLGSGPIGHDTAELSRTSATIERSPLVTQRSGARSGALIAFASLVAIGLNYIFLLAAGRLLGSEDYGTLAALLGLLTVILLPTAALQLGVSREVSRRLALGDDEGADAFGGAALRLGLLATVPIVALALALSVPVGNLLNIGSAGQVALAACGLAAALAFPIAIGVLQGYQRFPAVAALYVLPFALRLLLLVLGVSAGYRLGGAIFATVVAAVTSGAIAVALLREPLKRGARVARPALGPFLRYLFPVVVGLLGIAVLTNIDLLVVKARFSPDEVGGYAAASAFARVAFFLPATILAVLFPLTAARQARGEDTADILGRSLMVTAAFGGLLTLFYASAGRGLVHTSFGAEFAAGGDLLVPFTLSMTLFALANVLVGFHLSRGETRYAWIVAAAVPVQLIVLTLVPESLRGVIWADVLLGVSLIAAHELLVGSSVRPLEAGLHHFRRGIHLTRRALAEGSLVFVGGFAVVCVVFWPVVAHISSSIIGWPGSDSAGSVAWLWRTEREGGFHLLGTTQHTLTGAPVGWEEGNGLNLQWLLPYYPTFLAAKIVGEVAAYNLAAFSGYVLSGAAMYLLTRYLGCARLVAAWAALVYIIFPRHLAHAQHASLVHIEVLVLLVLALIAASRRPDGWRFLLVGLATFACWLTSGYFGVMAVIAAIGFSLGVAATTSGSRKLVLGSTLSSVVAATLVVVPSMLAGVGRDAGLDRKPVSLARYGLRPMELVLPQDASVALSTRPEDAPAQFHGSTPAETANYLGLLTLILATAWIVVAVRRRASLSSGLRAVTAGLAAVVVTSLLFAGASPVVAFGAHIRAPSGYLFEVVPAMRVPSRWVLLLMTALLPLAALALHSAAAHVGRSGRRLGGQSVATVVLVGGAMLVSMFELGISPAVLWYRTEPVPHRYEAVAQAPAGILAEYALVDAAEDPERANRYAFWQQSHGRPLLNGAPRGTRADDVRRVLLDPGARGTAEQLAFLGVTVITADARTTGLAAASSEDPAPEARLASGYALVARFADRSSVWRVVARPAPALVTLPDGFGKPRRTLRLDGLVGHPLVQPVAAGSIEFTARTPSVVRLSFDAIPPTGTRTVLRVDDSEREKAFTLAGRTAISILVRIPRGRSVLRVRSDPPSQTGVGPVLLTAPSAAVAQGRPALRTQLRSPEPDF
jgi:O-antigen/teichoic acid export membrane protein